MSDLWYIILLLVGFPILIYGAELLVNSASSLAKRQNVPNIVIGLTIVAFGTSSPELVVNVSASIQNNSDIVLGNILGSNIVNIFMILGISAIIFPLSIKPNTIKFEIPLCLLAAFVVLFAANDIFLDQQAESVISRIDGIMMLLFFAIFLIYNIQLMKSSSFTEDIVVKNYSIPLSSLLILGGITLLCVGGQLIVFSAIKVATYFQIPERIIALTIISIGTSLPELTTSVVAARKKNVDIAVGNIVGSNIFNIFFILGISAVIHPVKINASSNLDLLVNVLSSLLLLVFVFTGKDRKIDKWEGLIFVLLYCLYLIFMLLN